MIRISALRNHPVVSGHRRIGLLQSFCMDHAQKRVYALIVSCGMLGKCIVLPEHIHAVDGQFIIASEYQPYKRSFEQAYSLFARDSSGLLVGRVTDYAVDENTFRIIALSIQTGYLFARSKDYIWVFDYTYHHEKDSEIVIPACMGSELIM